MVVLDAATCGALLGGPYAQGAPQLKLVQKRYLGIHNWLSPIATKDLKEQIVSFWVHFYYKLTYYYYYYYWLLSNILSLLLLK